MEEQLTSEVHPQFDTYVLGQAEISSLHIPCPVPISMNLGLPPAQPPQPVRALRGAPLTGLNLKPLPRTGKGLYFEGRRCDEVRYDEVRFGFGGIFVGATPTASQGEARPQNPCSSVTGPPRHCTWYGPPGPAAPAQGESTAPAGGGGGEGRHHAGTAEAAGGQRGPREPPGGRDGPVRRALRALRAGAGTGTGAGGDRGWGSAAVPWQMEPP